MRKPKTTFVVAASAILLCFGIAAAEHGHRGGDSPGPTGTPSPTPAPTPAPAPLTTFLPSDFRGDYAASFHGTEVGTGILTADGLGNITAGTETVNDGTNVCKGTLTGTYTVNPDGTGTLTTNFTLAASGQIAGACPSSSSNHSAIVLVSPHHIAVSETDPGIVVIGTLTKQHVPQEHHGHAWGFDE